MVRTGKLEGELVRQQAKYVRAGSVLRLKTKGIGRRKERFSCMKMVVI